MPSDRITEMTNDECLRLLAANRFGRVAVNDDAGPIVLPVNYVVDDDAVLFRSSQGTKVEAAEREAPASFEIDAVDERTRTGWSVIARGTLSEVADPDQLERVRTLPAPFAGGDRPYLLRLVLAEVTGRRIELPEGVPGSWYRPSGLGHVWLDRDAADLGM